MRGFQAEGAAPLVTGEPFPDPETKATAIRIGNPASWKLAEAARDESGGRFAAVSDEQILAAQRELASRDGVFVEPASAAGVAGLLQELAAAASRTPAHRRVTVTGHGLKDTATALEGARRRSSTTVIDADVDRRGRGRRTRLTVRPSSTARSGSRSRPPRPTSGPASTRSASRSRCATSSRREVIADGPGVEVDRRRRRRRVPRDESPPRRPRDARGVRRDGRAAARAAARVRQRHPARARSRLVVGRDRRRRRAGPRRWSPVAERCSTTTRCSASPPRSRATPTTSRPPSTAASPSPDARAARSTRSAPPSTRGSAWSSSSRRTRSRPRSPADCCPPTVPHADAAADAGRTALLVAAARPAARAPAARHPRLPAPGLPAPGHARLARPGRRAARRRRRRDRVRRRADRAGVHRLRRPAAAWPTRCPAGLGSTHQPRGCSPRDGRGRSPA